MNKKHNPVPNVYFYRQGDFDAIPGSPWVYWITPGLRRVFEELPKLEEVAKPKLGMTSGDNFRFVRSWWEVGIDHIAFGCKSRKEALVSGKKWFPYMKGGEFRRWWGNQKYVVNWWKDGAEICNYSDETGRLASFPRNIDFYFRQGVTYSFLTSESFSARISPGGFIFDVAGSSLFPENSEDIYLILGVLNSTFAHYVLKIINPTVNFQVGDLARLPIPRKSSDRLRELVEKAIELAKKDAEEDETTWDFIAPPDWPDGIKKVARRHAELAEIECQIDEEVYRLYEISEEDYRAIEEELRIENSKSRNEGPRSLSKKELAQKWVSYAVGIVLGRFKPGVPGALGRGRFSEEIAEKLRNLIVPYGIAVLDKGHPHDLGDKVFEALSIIYGEEQTAKIIYVATEKQGDPVGVLRKYFAGQFFKEHIKLYRKRPIYWLLQSPKKKYGLYLFHEKLTGDTLYRIRGEEYVESKIKLLEIKINELRKLQEKAEGRERRRLEKEIAELEDTLEDVREFAKLIDNILKRGYRPYIDDGVLINMAPLWELIPSWQEEPKKCWKALERGDYDWSHMAMDYWPERVKEKCKTNKSYAIAHGLIDEEELEEEIGIRQRKKRK